VAATAAVCPIQSSLHAAVAPLGAVVAVRVDDLGGRELADPCSESLAPLPALLWQGEENLERDFLLEVLGLLARPDIGTEAIATAAHDLTDHRSILLEQGVPRV
jgi:hypothetical protein